MTDPPARKAREGLRPSGAATTPVVMTSAVKTLASARFIVNPFGSTNLAFLGYNNCTE